MIKEKNVETEKAILIVLPKPLVHFCCSKDAEFVSTTTVTQRRHYGPAPQPPRIGINWCCFTLLTILFICFTLHLKLSNCIIVLIFFSFFNSLLLFDATAIFLVSLQKDFFLVNVSQLITPFSCKDEETISIFSTI